jgi:hypothetical protein
MTTASSIAPNCSAFPAVPACVTAREASVGRPRAVGLTVDRRATAIVPTVIGKASAPPERETVRRPSGRGIGRHAKEPVRLVTTTATATMTAMIGTTTGRIGTTAATGKTATED